LTSKSDEGKSKPRGGPLGKELGSLLKSATKKHPQQSGGKWKAKVDRGKEKKTANLPP